MASLANEEIVGQAGQVASYEAVAALLVAMPETIDHAAHSRELSFLLVLALGLSRVPSARRPQLDFLDQQLGAMRGAKCRELAAELDTLNDRFRLPVLELCMPALRQRPSEQLTFLMDILRRVSDLNDDEKLFDYVLMRVLESYLRAGARSLPALKTGGSARVAVLELLGCVAAYGHDDPRAALEAYRAGLARIFAAPPRLAEPDFAELNGVRKLEALDSALGRLALLRPKQKQRVLGGVLACIRHDQQITTAEMELFRAIAATLGCPMPLGSAIGQ